MRLNGRGAQYQPGALAVWFGATTYLEIDAPGLPKAELLKMGRAVAPAGRLAEPSTWADARDALPH